jgi:hypothetical protein
MLVVSGDTAGLPAMAPAARVDRICQRSRQIRRLAACGREPCVGHAPRLVDGTRAAGHPHRAERCHALERDQVADEHLATPDRAVRAVPGAVVDRPHRRALQPVLGETGGEVGVVVLDPGQLDVVELEGVGRRRVVRMQVVCDEFGT